MYISVDTLRQRFSSFPSFSVSNAAKRGLVRLLPLRGEQSFDRSYLYYAEQLSELEQTALPTDMHILVFCDALEEDDRAKLTILSGKLRADILAFRGEPGELCGMIDRYFELQVAYSMFADSMLNILAEEGGIQQMVEHSYMFLENPVFVFDSDFTLLAGNREAIAELNAEQRFLEKNGLTADGRKLLERQDHIHQRVLRSEEPLRVLHPEIGVEQMVCAISTKKDMGHVVLCATNRPVTDDDARALKLLANAVLNQMNKDTFVRNNQGFHYEYFLSDLLDGKIATQKQFMDRLSYVHCAFSETNYCLVADLARKTKTAIPALIRDSFERVLPNTKALIYNGAIVVVFSLPKNMAMTDVEHSKLEEISQKYGLFCGLSNRFSDILELPEYYRQALRAIELGVCRRDEAGLFRYGDFALEHIRSVFCAQQNTESFYHPDLKTLLRYDAENGTSYAHIWYTYLTHERNMVVTSSVLYTHRNTLSYQMRRIAELLQADYDDPDQRQYFIISYELHDRN